MGNRKLSGKERSEIQKLYSEGYTQTALSAKFNVSRTTIARVLDPEYYARTLESAKDYQKENAEAINLRRSQRCRSYNLLLNRAEDAAVIQRLDEQENVHDYIRRLIKDDIAKNQ